MAYAFVTPNGTASAGNASGGALALTKPSGVADGHLLVVAAYLESDTNTWTPPSGWNTAAGLTQDNTGVFQLQVFWKIAASEPASWTWTPGSSAWRALVLAAYSGATGSGSSRVDIQGGSQGDTQGETGQTAPSVTTTVDGDLVVFAYGNFGGVDTTSLIGFATNLRVTLGGVCIGDAIKSPAGATGTTRAAGTGTQDYATLHVAFLLDTGGGGASVVPILMRQYRARR